MAKGLEVNKKDLSDTLGISLPTVGDWVSKGCPVVQHGGNGREWIFNTADVAKWREQQIIVSTIGDSQRMDFEEAKRRKTAAEASMAELDLAVQKGELIEIAVVSDSVGEDYANCRAKLMNITSRLIGELNQDQCDMVDSEIREALTELSQYVG